MRAKNAARGGRKSSTTSTTASTQRFNLGELVICRYSTYPYWPATIDQTHQARYKGAHVLKRRTRRGDKVLAYWCTFSNEDTGGWVRHDRITRYHPDIVPKIRLDESDEFFDDQAEAFKVAQRAYAALPASGRVHKPPVRLPKDFSANVAINSDDEDMLQSDGEEEEDDDDDDDDDIDDEQKEKTPPKPSNSRVKRRGSGRPSTKRNGASAPAPPAASAARESEDEMDLGDDSDDDPQNNVTNDNDKEDAKPSPRKSTKRARLSNPSQSNRRSSTISTGKAQSSTGRTARTSVTPKKEPRRAPAKRKPTTAPPVSRERKRNKTSSQNSVHPPPPKRVSSELGAEQNVVEIPVPNDPSSDGTPIVKKKLNSELKPSTTDKSSDSEHDDPASPNKRSLSKPVSLDSPSVSKKRVVSKEKSGDAAKETSKGSENKAPDPDSKSEVKSSSSDAAKSSSSSVVEGTARAMSKSKSRDESSDKSKPHPKTSKEDDSFAKKSGLASAQQKSDSPNTLPGGDSNEASKKKSYPGQSTRPGGNILDPKGVGPGPKSEEKGVDDKDGDVDMKDASESTVKIDVCKGIGNEEDSKEKPVEVKIVLNGAEPEPKPASTDQNRIEAMESKKKDEGTAESVRDAKSSKPASRGGPESSNEESKGHDNSLNDGATSTSRPPKTSGTSPKQAPGTTSEKKSASDRKTTGKPQATSKENPQANTKVRDDLRKDSKTPADSPSKAGKETGFVKIDIGSKTAKEEKPKDLPEVKILSSRDMTMSKGVNGTGQKSETPDSRGLGESESAAISKRSDQQTVANKDNSVPVAKVGRSASVKGSDVVEKTGDTEPLVVSKGIKAGDADRGGSTKAADSGSEMVIVGDTAGPTASFSNAARPTTGAKQPIMVKVPSSRPPTSAEEGNKVSKANVSKSTTKEKSSGQVASKQEKLKLADDAERLAKMSENSAIQAGIASDGVQEDGTQEFHGDIGSTEVKRQASSDTTEMDVVMEGPANTLEELKDQLERARLTIGKLRSKLKALDESREKSSATASLATFVMPIAPDNLQLDLPSQDLYMSDPVDADRFVDVVQHIRKTFDNFKTRVKTAEFARNELQSQAIELQKRYEEKCETVLKAEEEAVMEERELIDILKKLLIYKVNAAELKKHKAGSLVRSIGKTCKQMPAVANLCNEIYVTWRSHFLRYLVSSTEKAKEVGEHKSDGMGLQKKDETEKRTEEKPQVGRSKAAMKSSTVVANNVEEDRAKQRQKEDQTLDKGSAGGVGAGCDDDDDDDREDGDVDMEDADNDNGDDAEMEDDESADDGDDGDEGDDDDASEKKPGGANDDDDDDLE